MKVLFTKVWTKPGETKKPIARSLQQLWASDSKGGSGGQSLPYRSCGFRRSPPDGTWVEKQLARKPRG